MTYWKGKGDSMKPDEWGGTLWMEVTQIGYQGANMQLQQKRILGGHLGNMLIRHSSY